MKRIICIRFVALFVLLTMILSACSDKNKTEDTDSENKPEENQTNDTDSENKPEENRYIDCEPGYKQSSGNACATGRIAAYSMEEYLALKPTLDALGFTSENWLPWEQFSVLGEFQVAYLWEEVPEDSSYDYLYTDEETGKSCIYAVKIYKFPKNSGVTNIKEYYQWWYGNEYETEYAPKISFIDDDASVDSDFIALLTKDDYHYRTYYYKDEILFSETNIEFVFDGWKIAIYSINPNHRNEGESYFIDFHTGNCISKPIQQLLNANTYKEAIAELMDPTNKNLPKQPVDSEIARQIKKGMTYSEIHEILRNPGEDIGSGAILYEWELDNGDVLHVWFQSSTELIAINVRIDQKS